MLKQLADPTDSHSPDSGNRLEHLQKVLDHAAHLLPAQGPISVFIHHNTLHAFEHLPFSEATERAARVFGCEPYLTEARFHSELDAGRIRPDDLQEVLRGELGDSGHKAVATGVTRSDLRLAMLLLTPWEGTPAELRWKVAEDGVPRHHAGLWQRCVSVVRALPSPTDEHESTRPRDAIVRAGGADPDLLVKALLIRYSAAFIDQGVSRLAPPNQDDGYLQCFCQLYARNTPLELWHRDLVPLCQAASAQAHTPIQSILESLEAIGIDEGQWEEFLSATLLDLRGWGGILHEVEARPDRVHHPIPAGTFVEFVAVRLLLDRAATAFVARDDLGYVGPLAGLRTWLAGKPTPAEPSEAEGRVYEVYQAARALKLSVEDISVSFAREVMAFPSLRRRWIFQLAYERRFRVRTLDALAHRVTHPVRSPSAPRFQVVTCLDEREESFRRHLEEVAPDCETFGAAGFFGAVMYYRGVAEAHYKPLCPVVVQPKHWVQEQPGEAFEESARRAQQARRALGRTSHQFHLGTRGFALGAVITAGFGVLATFPLVARVLFPGLTALVRRRAGWIVRAPKKTRLLLERTDPAPGPEGGGIGFSVDEMTGIAERLLRDIGLTRTFARLVFILGHGSHSMNNPHESAHDCGACGGAVGGPNGRAGAQILNDPRVRAGLAARGLTVPDGTVFVGGLHNTSNEYVKFADADLIPDSHRAEFEAAHREIEQAVDRNAHERARRFDSAPLSITPASARQHMDARAEDLAQVRPEWGHASNAICIVGRRALTRGLYFDRRAFLTSYDPAGDTPDAAILARTLGAVYPVCAGINLEYYFSNVDPAGYGAGTKLPHNITGLIGVMDGAASDLRTGLPWQMTEIHEPIRLLLVIETTVAIFKTIMAGNAGADGMTRNGWVQVALIHPTTGAIVVFEKGNFVPFVPGPELLRRVHSSLEWYGGKRGYLEFVEVAQVGGAFS